MRSNLTAVVLAAGESTRFEPFSEIKNKPMFVLAGEPIVKRTVRTLINFGLNRVVVVHNTKNQKELKASLKEFGSHVVYCLQEKQKGTGNALKKAAPHIAGQFILLNFEQCGVEKELSAMLKTKAPMVVMTSPTETPYQYGIIKLHPKQKNRALSIIEKPARGKEPSNIRTLGAYLLPYEFLKYLENEPEHPHSLVHAINKYAYNTGFHILSAKQKPVSIKYAFDILDAAKKLTDELKKKNIAKNIKISKNAVLNGVVRIGKNTVVKEGAVIHGPVWIGENCVIGNNVIIRPNSVIENEVRLGTFAEIKASVIGHGTHIHSGYIGDSVIGENCRIGAGFITANRRTDRGPIKFTVNGAQIQSNKTYLGCVVGHGTKIGIKSSTMPGAIIGNNCVIGSNTEIKGTIPSDSLIYTERTNVVKKRNK